MNVASNVETLEKKDVGTQAAWDAFVIEYDELSVPELKEELDKRGLSHAGL